ncbi:MAG: M18 family aminopeptidase [SAR86 cluster bacterium]|uniref:M18 family aminopeptidase n=1 Tax=SAR86 cluster bacterium TaxID=2030880 RepID=A0A2A5BAZ1_9GAMM|nr:MAG: M18 family aminopeptidase [SAR86 cluster bacterium]
MEKESFNTGLLQFLQQSPTPFHAVASMSAILEQAGFRLLSESDSWKLENNTSYYVVRNDSAIIAFKTGRGDLAKTGLRIAGAHTDSPCLKIKPSPEVSSQNYQQLGVEVYGGALLHPWFDRDLSIAGRVDYQTDGGELESALIDFKEPVAFIPSLAIHLDRTANEGRKINKQKELPAILLQLAKDESFDFDLFLLEHLQKVTGKITAAKVLSHELLLYDTQAPSLVGFDKQFLASARLDNLLSCYLCLIALIESEDDFASVLVCNDHEEVGSVSTSGAEGPFLKSVLERMQGSAQSTIDGFDRAIHNSVLLSVDNAHGAHPNFADKHDEHHRPLLNSGPVIKINANQRYASNSQSVALFKSLCNKLNIAHQSFVMRSDMACGSTIGPITAASLGVTTVDVGVASFAMHSIREFAGIDDVQALATVITAFYSR